jgi:hypothetical protein
MEDQPRVLHAAARVHCPTPCIEPYHLVMKQTEFNARFTTLEPGKDFDPPACEGGLILLRRWANQDPTLLNLLSEIPPNAEGPHARALYDHRNRYPKCNEHLPARPEIDIP